MDEAHKGYVVHAGPARFYKATGLPRDALQVLFYQANGLLMLEAGPAVLDVVVGDVLHEMVVSDVDY